MRFVVCFAILAIALTETRGQVGYTYGAKVLGAKVHYVVVNPMSGNIRITPAYVAGGLPFEAFIALYRPIAAINENETPCWRHRHRGHAPQQGQIADGIRC